MDKVAEACAQCLVANKWAVLDNFAPKATVQKVRSEIEVMNSNYEAGEIWVGRSADVGAQIKKSNVRGDVVLWLGKEALNAKEFVVDGRKRKCCFHVTRALIATVDQFIMTELPK